MFRIRIITRFLERRPPWQMVTVAAAAAFAAYFSMYGFRKPFSAAQFADQSFSLWGGVLELKTALMIGQIFGYAISKFIGIRFCSQIQRGAQFAALIGLIGCAELSLLVFAIVPHDWKVLVIFLNGVPLGMVWGIVVRYLEGRRSSDVLLAVLCCSFILASSLVKDVGLFWMNTYGVSESWMPFVTGLCFLPSFVVSAWVLEQLPAPSQDDIADRAERTAMHSRERYYFLRENFLMLVPIFVLYVFLTAFRDFRDNYGPELLSNLGVPIEDGIFTRIELPVAFISTGALALLFWIRNHATALAMIFAVMFTGMAMIGLSTMLLSSDSIGGVTWVTLTGLGAYLAYVPVNAVLFDRVVAATRSPGNAVFAIYVADALGYSGSVALQLARDFAWGQETRLEFFSRYALMTSLVGCIAMVLSGVALAMYLRRRATTPERAPSPVPLT